jgi:predicted N-acetyltransferase YhbS
MMDHVATELSFRQDYLGDPNAWRALATLLEDIFGIDVALLDDLGGPEPGSMPFGWFDAAGQCVANLTAFPMPLMLGDRTTRVYGLQSGAVRPQWRGQGLYRDVLARALSWCESQRAELVILTTETPELYTKAGFRSAAQHRFLAPPPTAEAVAPQARLLNLTRWADLELLQGLLAQRTPVSTGVAVTGHAAMFLLNAASTPSLQLSYLPSVDAVVAWDEEDTGTFRLVDIVGGAIPSLGFILAALNKRPAAIEICFPPDRLGCEAKAAPLEDKLVLMVKGDLPDAMRNPFSLPPTAAF